MIGHCSYDLCDTDAVLYQVHSTGITEVMGSNPVQAWMFFSGFNFKIAEVVHLTAMINHVLITFFAVQIYDLSYLHLYTITVLLPESSSVAY